jgi:uncharacterized phage protein gp47/JayE
MPSGFRVPTYEEVRAQAVEQWKQTWGRNAKTASDTIDGLEIDVTTLNQRRHYEAVGEAYNAHFFSTAADLQLDALLDLFGIRRLAPLGSVAEVTVYGTDTTVIPQGSTASTIDTGSSFALDNETTIAAGEFAVFLFGETLGATTITATIGVEDSVIATGGAATATELRDLMLSTIVTNTNVAAAFSGGAQPNDLEILVVRMQSTFTFSIASTSGSEVQSHDAVLAQVTSGEVGPIEAEARTLTRIGSPTSGWIGITNVADATLGRTNESDPGYRARFVEVRDKLGSGRIDTLEAKIGLLDGVEVVTVYHNTRNFTDLFGRPPHSFEVVVIGGSEDEIAKEIVLDHQAGIASTGSIFKQVLDERGNIPMTRDVYLTRPTSRYMHCLVQIDKGEGFPSTATADLRLQVQQLTANYGKTLGIGRDVLVPEFISAVSGLEEEGKIPGISQITFSFGATLGPTDPTPGLSPSNFAISELEISDWDATRVSVSII